MQERNLLEDLVAVSPGMEIWWDSSPVIFGNWCKKMLAKADAGDQGNLECQFARMYDVGHPMGQLFRGVTTNPPLSLAAFKDDPARWEKVAQKVLADNPGLDTEGLFWVLYKEVVRQGSDMFLPLFEASGYKEGFLSGQVDPRSAFDGDAMLAQALEIHAVNPNVMVKVPGTAEGYAVIEELTSRGIATNNTLTFVLSQLHGLREVREARPREGQGQRRRPLASGARSSPTWRPATATSAACVKPAPRRASRSPRATCASPSWPSSRRPTAPLKERDYHSKMLSCSLRLGPTVDGKQQIWHLEEKAGADIVVTCPPSLIDEVINFPHPEDIKFKPNQIAVDPPKEVMDKLMQIPYFSRAYDEDGYTRAEYNTHPALVKTHEAFSKATNEMVAFADSCLKGNCRAG